MRNTYLILMGCCAMAIAAGFSLYFGSGGHNRRALPVFNDAVVSVPVKASTPSEVVPSPEASAASSDAPQDHSLLLKEYEKLARAREFRAAKALLPELMQIPAVHTLAAGRYRELLAQTGPVEDRIRVCGYLLLILNDEEILELWKPVVCNWDCSTPDSPRLREWTKHDKRRIDEPASDALNLFEEDVIAAESIAFWITSVFRTGISEDRTTPIRALLKHDVDCVDDPLLSLVITRVANMCLFNNANVSPEGMEMLRGILASLRDSGVSPRFAYQIKVILAEPAADLVEFLNRLNEAEGRKEAIQLLTRLLADDFYVKSDMMLVISALLLRFGAAEAGYVIDYALADLPHVNDSTYVCRLAQVLGEGILKDDTDIQSQHLCADFIAKLVAQCNVRRFFAETPANRRVAVLRDLPDGGLRVVRHLRRADTSKSPADRTAFDLFTRCVLIYELDVSLLQKNEEVLDELALHQEFPFSGLDVILGRLAHNDVQELLLYEESTVELVRLLVSRAEPIVIKDEMNLSQCWNISQCIIHLSKLKSILGGLDVSVGRITEMKSVLEPYRKALQRAKAYDNSMELYFTEVYQALGVLE